MAIAFKVIGDIQKVNDSRGRPRGFGVLLELYFSDGQTKQYRYMERTKKELIANMNNGKMARWIDCTRLDERGNLGFEIRLTR